jgi:hypothetical protein
MSFVNSTYTVDLYLDQTSLYPVRIELGQTRGSYRSSVLSRFIAFNAPLRIVPPTAFTTPRAPTDLQGVSASVTPNPMPSNAIPTLTVTAAPGSRCTARVVYQQTAPGTSSPATLHLGTRLVGRRGTVQWSWRAAPHATGGNAIVDCTRGRGAINQVDSFTIFF